MAPSGPPPTLWGPVTLKGACDYLRMLDTYYPGYSYNIGWRDANTGQPVSIGYTH